MNILVIGNGFDLAHDLPTKYTDFLDFIKCISEEEPWNTSYNIAHKEYFTEYAKNKSNEYIQKMISLSENNIWIKWFKHSAVKENWVDFEAEISRVIQQLDQIVQLVRKESQKMENFSNFVGPLQKLWKEYHFTGFVTTKKVTKIRNELIGDLNNLIRCLELYLIDYVSGIEITTLSPDIYDLPVNKVLSFNYTSTYSNLYEVKNDEIEYDYIHGKAKYLNDPPNNMVLGIDEYLQGNAKDSNIMFIEFKKYFQRIHKSTGSIYKKWIQNSKETYNVYFFGHSLNITDKDVLRDIILCDNAHVTIYYHSSEQYASQIKNLVQVLSQEKLISMVYGKNPKIKFKCQQEMVDKEQVGWQITRDILILEKWYNFNDNELKLIENRIRQALENNDLNYFHSQKKLVALYDALKSYSKEFSKYEYKEKFLKIGNDLFNSDRYDLNIWKKELEGKINNRLASYLSELNGDQQSQSELKFDDLECLKKQLINQLKQQKFPKEKATEIIKKLFSMFSDCNNVPLLSECICIVGENFNSEQWEVFIEDMIKQSSGIEKKRYEHLKSKINERLAARKKSSLCSS